jgi:hypothetical protein
VDIKVRSIIAEIKLTIKYGPRTFYVFKSIKNIPQLFVKKRKLHGNSKRFRYGNAPE